MSGLVDPCVGMLNAIGGGIDETILAKLAMGPEAFNAGLYRMAVAVHDTAVKPVAATVASVVFTLELARMSVRADGDRALGVRIVGALLLKCALVLLFASNAVLLLKGVDQLTGMVTERMGGLLGSGGGAGSEPLGERMRPAIEEAGVIGQSGLMVLVLIPFLVAQIAGVVLTVVVWMRFMQIYMLTCFASLPVAFLACEETRHMGVGYFRRYAQASLQSVTLSVGVALYRAFIADSLKAGDWDGGDLWGWTIGNFGVFLAGSIMLVFLVAVSSSASRAVLGG